MDQHPFSIFSSEISGEWDCNNILLPLQIPQIYVYPCTFIYLHKHKRLINRLTYAHLDWNWFSDPYWFFAFRTYYWALLTKHMLHSPHVLACIKMSNLLLPSVNEDNCITLLLAVIALDLHSFQNVVSSLNFKGVICDSSSLFFYLKW